MSDILITFPDQSSRSFATGVSSIEIAESIGPGLAKAAVAARIDGLLTDLTQSIDKNADFEIITELVIPTSKILLKITIPTFSSSFLFFL